MNDYDFSRPLRAVGCAAVVVVIILIVIAFFLGRCSRSVEFQSPIKVTENGAKS
jgi:uncharacterized membrane protein YqiK